MPSVLVVDDDPDVRVMLETYLELEGFDVLTASNGFDALQRLRDARPSVILLDLMMPVMDGVEFRRHQQGQPVLRDIPVVCLSARHDAKQTATRLGVTDCLAKPLDLEMLMAVLRRHCPEPPPAGTA
jgi:CheY-like chemotaxis protein